MSALDKQTGGNHYKQFVIQPIEFITKNKLGFGEGNVIKYICRHPFKNGVEDIDKVIHYCELLKELTYGVKPSTQQVELPIEEAPTNATDLATRVATNRHVTVILKSILHQLFSSNMPETIQTINDVIASHKNVDHSKQVGFLKASVYGEGKN